MQQISSTLFWHRSGKMTQNIFYSWFFIVAFITRTFAFFMFILVLFFNQVYLSLHFDEYRWETSFEWSTLRCVTSFIAFKILILHDCRNDRSGKTAWVYRINLCFWATEPGSEVIYLHPERIIWCYSQWQSAYTEMLVGMPRIEFVEGIPTALEQDPILMWTNGIWSCLMIRLLTPAKTSELWTSLLVVLIIAI